MSETRSRYAIIVDDHPLARMAIRSVLDKESIIVDEEYEDGSLALKSLLNTTADIIIIDIEIPGINGIELVEKLRDKNYNGVLIVVSAKNDRYYSKRCAQAGANAFISKKQSMDNILAAINAAQNGYIYFPFYPKDDSKIMTDSQRLESLSAQEMKVMGHILRGLDNSQIGEVMHISGKTVSTYKTRLMEKLGCKSLIELLTFAHQNKLT
ncbi:acid-sensing system DNA-binding response regulator EvgA [Escherichia coli]|uniref:acid-sensing system DNA-binding response regulator EvgA n=1 Tax=Escherichia coli TaxID=562 RepID=UPI000BB94F7E|nr:acid-sensing system DNA-binding response regulator EvgA [Escherichia coli]EFN9100893.1 DNA-binding transcriptional activator EvgA [Escherichia coli]EIY1065390.1 acid-sensing system DNA-binding response regulator EvgA [Escherichia coli]EKR5637783.1 acid-sensing system DNA-binding response regulator EvgA [Escherichia coli]EKR7626532.1 acid-sensing system DNA-binding response regulator EvgA [Escherichia coli]ELD1760593.1 acid-sensing system DNA-binding response regulator EvgA [Escherichia coli